MRLAACLVLAIPLGAYAQPDKGPPPRVEPAKKETDSERAERARKTKEAEDTGKAAGKAAAGLFGMGLLATVVVGVLVFIVNIIPSCIAIARGHPNAAAIVAVNLLLGCTGVGWVVALVWSLTAIDHPRSRR